QGIDTEYPVLYRRLQPFDQVRAGPVPAVADMHRLADRNRHVTTGFGMQGTLRDHRSQGHGWRCFIFILHAGPLDPATSVVAFGTDGCEASDHMIAFQLPAVVFGLIQRFHYLVVAELPLPAL